MGVAKDHDQGVGVEVAQVLLAESDEHILECYDLEADPLEQVDLAPERPGEAARRKERFLKRARQEQKMALSATSSSGDRRVDDALRGLGYLR